MGQDTVLRRTGDELAHYQCRLVRVCRCGRAGCVSCVLSSCDGLFLCLFVQRWWYRGGPGRLWDGRVSAKRNSSVMKGTTSRSRTLLRRRGVLLPRGCMCRWVIRYTLRSVLETEGNAEDDDTLFSSWSLESHRLGTYQLRQGNARNMTRDRAWSVCLVGGASYGCESNSSVAHG